MTAAPCDKRATWREPLDLPREQAGDGADNDQANLPSGSPACGDPAPWPVIVILALLEEIEAGIAHRGSSGWSELTIRRAVVAFQPRSDLALDDPYPWRARAARGCWRGLRPGLRNGGRQGSCGQTRLHKKLRTRNLEKTASFQSFKAT